MTAFGTHAHIATKASQLAKAATIFQYTHASASSLLQAFDAAKLKRGNPRGILTDQEQDILRAALVMSCAGLDAALKQAIKDSLSHLVGKNDLVRKGFEDFIQKRLATDKELLGLVGGSKFLAKILADPEPRKRLVEEYITDLTGDSLQSAEEVLRTLVALGLDPRNVGVDIPRLKEIFRIRNKIIHELDIDLDSRFRKRKVRAQAELLDNSDYMLGRSKAIIEALDKRL